MSSLIAVPGRIGAYHDLYASRGPGICMAGFWAANARFLRQKRQTLLDVAMEASAAQWEAGEEFADLSPRLQQAVRETNPSIGESTWSGMDEDQRMGAINAAKGKYFEYLVVDRLNSGGQVGGVMLVPGQEAQVAESMNQPGWDVRIVDDEGGVVHYLQMKATDSGSYIRDALERYPDVQIMGTSEAAGQLDGNVMVLDAGMDNTALQKEVGHAVDLANSTAVDRFVDYFCPLWPLMAIATMEGYRIAVGQASLAEFSRQLAERGKRLIAIKLAGASVFALGGGLLAIPAGLAGGLWYDRFKNYQRLEERYTQGTDRLVALAVYRHRQLQRG